MNDSFLLRSDSRNQLTWWRRLLLQRRIAGLGMLAVMILMAQEQSYSQIVAPNAPGQVEDGDLAKISRAIAEQTAGVDWAQESPKINLMLDRIWARNRWKGESNEFALSLAKEVSAVPPADFMRRIELIGAKVSKRYGLGEADEAKVRAMVAGQASALIVKNSRVMLKHAMEFSKPGRIAALPTAAQVAEFSKESEPMLDEVHRMVERSVAELQQSLSPEKKAILSRDLDAFRARHQTIVELSKQWAKGEWKPEHWGFEPGAATSATAQPPTPEAAATRSVTATPTAVTRSHEGGNTGGPTRCVVEEPPTWFLHVDQFSARLQLDSAQRSAARSVHDELHSRARDYLLARDGRLEAIDKKDRAKSPDFDFVRSLFQEMQTRLESIPTTAQREAAGPNPSVGATK